MTIPSAGTPVLNAITATGTTTSTVVNVENFDNLIVQFTAASISSGNGVFTIDVSNDGKNFYTGASFVDMQSTATTTSIVTKTLSSNTTFMGFLSYSGFKYLRIKVVVTTDGTYTAWLTGNARR